MLEQKILVRILLSFHLFPSSYIVRRLAKLNILFFQSLPKIMTLIRFVQRASILTGITFASIAFQNNSAIAQTEKFCVIASNGKTACGTLKAIERACVTTDGNAVICGKFKSVAAEQGQEAVKPDQGDGSLTVVDNFAFSLKSCRRSNTIVKCNFSIRNKDASKTLQLSAGESSMVDLSGKTYKASRVDAKGESSKTIINIKMVSEIDYQAVYTFDNVPKEVKKIQVLSLSSGNISGVNFRDITISN